METHSIGEAFALLNPDEVSRLDLPPSMHGSVIYVRARGLGDADAIAISKHAGGESLRPPSPVHLRAARTAAGELQVTWVRRSRFGWSWPDEIDCPLGEERELYRVTMEGNGTRFQVETDAPSALFGESEVASIAPGAAALSVQQIGDRAASRPALVYLSLG